MRLLFLVVSFCFLVNGFGQTVKNPLPVVKDGRWYLFTGKEKIPLPLTYTTVGIFDSLGLACFSEGNNKGIINFKGEEIQKSIYKDLESYGNGIFRHTVQDGFLLAGVNRKVELKCNWSQRINDFWIIYTYEGRNFLMHNSWEKGIELKKDSSELFVSKSFYNYVVIRNNNNYTAFYDPFGNLLEEGDNLLCDIKHNYLYFKGKKNHFILDPSGKLDFSLTAESVEIQEDNIYFLDGKICHLLDRKTKKVYFKIEADGIQPYSSTMYLIWSGNKYGFASREGKVLLKPIYESVYEVNNRYLVRKNEMAGILDLNFKELVPCVYNSLWFRDNFIHTRLGNAKYGLLSGMDYTEILPAYYDRILVTGSLVKAYTSSGTMTLLQLDEKQKVRDKVTMENVLSIHTNNLATNRSLPYFDPRLLYLGWYYDTVSVFDKKGNWKNTGLRWGIKNLQDSVLLKTSLPTPVYVEKAPFSMVKIGTDHLNLFSNLKEFDEFFNYGERSVFVLYDYSTGKRLRIPAIYNIDTTDFRFYDFARVLFRGEYGICLKDLHYRSYRYVDAGKSELIRVCSSGIADTCRADHPEAVYAYSLRYNNRGSGVYLHFQNATWNYLNGKGDSLFSEPFLFGQPFFKETAIVRAKTGWGVVNKDSLIIPAKFSAIERINTYSDTLFLVRLDGKGKVYLDSNMNLLSFERTMQPEKQINGLNVFSDKGEAIVLNPENETIYKNVKAIKFKNHGYFTTKDKKEFVIYDITGTEVSRVPFQPEHFISTKFFTAEVKSKIGLFNLTGDTVLPCIYEKIEMLGAKIVATSAVQVDLFDSELKKIKQIKGGFVYVDSLSEHWAMNKGGTITVYDEKDNKLYRWKTHDKVVIYRNKRFYTKEGRLFEENGEKLNKIPLFDEVQFFPDGYSAFKDKDKKWHLFNESDLLMTDTLLKNRKIVYHSDHVFSMETKEGFKIVDFANNIQYSNYSEMKGNFQSGYVVVKNKGHYNYINRDFKDPFNRHFRYAEEFKNDYAVIQDESGWTLIGKDGFPQSLPTYSLIRQLNKNLFVTSVKPLFGIYDANGNIFIEPIYEKLTFLGNGLIQALKDGEVFYFNTEGTRLY